MGHKELSKEYLAIEVYSSCDALGHGNRVIYWAASDGHRSILFNCLGERYIVANADLSFSSVLNVAAHSFEGGRLRYQHTLDSPWIDGGPICAESVKPDDPSLSVLKQRLGKELSFEELIEGEDDGRTWGESDEW